MSEEISSLEFYASGEIAQEFKKLCDECGVKTDSVLYNYMKRIVFSNEIVLTGANKKTVEGVSKKMDVLDFFKKTDPHLVIEALNGEAPYLVALFLSVLNNPAKVSLLLQNLPEEMLGPVSEILAQGIMTDENLMNSAALYFKKKIETANAEGKIVAGGIDFFVKVANLMDRSAEKTMVEGMEERNPDLAEEIKKRMFVFEDIVMLDDRAVQKILREVDAQELARALKGTEPEVVEKIQRNMSTSAWRMLKEYMDFMGPVRLKDVEETQQKIVSIIRRLEDCGEIVIVRSSGEMFI